MKQYEVIMGTEGQNNFASCRVRLESFFPQHWGQKQWRGLSGSPDTPTD